MSQERLRVLVVERDDHGEYAPRMNSSLYKEPESDECNRCRRYIYPLECMGPVMGYKYHRQCFRCHTCDRLLDFKNYRTNLVELADKQIYCSTHNPRSAKQADIVYFSGMRSRSKSPGVLDHAAYKSYQFSDIDQPSAVTTPINRSNGNLLSEYGSAARASAMRSASGSSLLSDSTRPRDAPTAGGSRVEMSSDEFFANRKLDWQSINSSQHQEEKHHSSVMSSSESRFVAQSHHHHHHQSETASSSSSSSMSAYQKANEFAATSPISRPFNAPSGIADHHTSAPPATNVGDIIIDIRRSPSPQQQQQSPSQYAPVYVNSPYDATSGTTVDLASETTVRRGSSSDSAEYRQHFGASQTPHISQICSEIVGTDAAIHRHQQQHERHASDLNSYSRISPITGSSSSTDTVGGAFGAATNAHDHSPHLRSIISEIMDHEATHHSRLQRRQSFESSTATTTVTNNHHNNNSNTRSGITPPLLRKDDSNHSFGSTTGRRSSSDESASAHSAAAHSAAHSVSNSNLYNIYSDMVLSADSQRQLSSNLGPVAAATAATAAVASLMTASHSASNFAAANTTNTSTTMTNTVTSNSTTMISSSNSQQQTTTTIGSSGDSTSNLRNIVIDVNRKADQEHIARNPAAASNQPTTSHSTPIHVQIDTERYRPAISPAQNIIVDIVEHDSPHRPANYQPTNQPSASQHSTAAAASSAQSIGVENSHSNLHGIIADVIYFNSTRRQVPPPPLPPVAIPQSQSPLPQPQRRDTRAMTTILGDDKFYGAIRLTVHYDELRSRFSVTVHEARNLRGLDKKHLSDPYARIYMTPDEKPTLKRKSRIIKNNLNPIWQETFDYHLTYPQTVGKTLRVNLKDERGIFEKAEAKFLGEVVIQLKSVIDLRYPFTRWYYLQALNSNANILADNTLLTR